MMKIANPFERFEITQADYDGNENYGRFVIEPLERGFAFFDSSRNNFSWSNSMKRRYNKLVSFFIAYYDNIMI